MQPDDVSPACASGVAVAGVAAGTSVGGKAVGVGDATGAAGVAVAESVAWAISGEGVAVGWGAAVGVGLAGSGVGAGSVAVGAELEAACVGAALLWLEQAVTMITNAQRTKKEMNFMSQVLPASPHPAIPEPGLWPSGDGWRGSRAYASG